MTISIIPIQAVANQTLQSVINNQPTTLNIYQTGYSLQMDVYFGSSLIVPGVLCQNQNRIIRSIYLGYSGDFEFYDTQPDPFYGPMDPVYTGLGSRFVLLYDTNSFGLAGQY